MQLLIAQILVLLVTIRTGVESELSRFGAHVCLETETYQEKTQINTLRPREVTVKKRCWNALKLFSCKKKEVIWENHIEYTMVPRSKLVARCCDGFVEVGKTCVPHCRLKCLHGKCVAPNICDCDPGFFGFNCTNECLEGYWGKYCSLPCNCVNGRCDNILGCVCNSGWMGLKCESVCPDGYYGDSCKNKCDCNEATCSHITGECITTTTEATTSTSIAFSTESLIQVATERDEISTTDTTQSHSTLTETSTEVHNATEWSTTTNYLSITGSFEIPVHSERNFLYEIKQVSTESTGETDAVNSETVTVIEMKFSEADELESTNIVVTKSTTEIETFETEITTMRIRREEDERETNLVNNEMTQSSTIFPLGTVNEPNIEKHKTSWTSITTSNENADKNKTDNFIFEGKGNSGKETIFKFLHFLPSLCVVSAVSFLIVIIVARWMIVNHRRKTKTLVVAGSKKGNIFQLEDGVKFHSENIFWVNNCTVNPVYMTDVDFNPTPILQTFKPLEKEKVKGIVN